MVMRILDEYLKPYLAHVRQDDDGSFVVHDLEAHLRAVADLAGEFASIFGCPKLEHEKMGVKG
jgi:hypothetical protein